MPPDLWHRFLDVVYAFAGQWWAIGTSGVIGVLLKMKRRKGLIRGRKPTTWWKLALWRVQTPVGWTNLIWAVIFVGCLIAYIRAFDSINVENYKYSVPQFSLEIREEDISRVSNDLVLVQLFVVVRNVGAPASIVAGSWQMRVKLPSTEIALGIPSNLDEMPRIICAPDRTWHTTIERSDDLTMRAATVIEKNNYRDGIISFTFPEKFADQLVSPDAEITLSATDALSKPLIVSIAKREIADRGHHTFSSSLSHPNALPGCPF